MARVIMRVLCHCLSECAGGGAVARVIMRAAAEHLTPVLLGMHSRMRMAICRFEYARRCAFA